MNLITILNLDTIKKNENCKSINERFYERNEQHQNQLIDFSKYLGSCVSIKIIPFFRYRHTCSYVNIFYFELYTHFFDIITFFSDTIFRIVHVGK